MVLRRQLRQVAFQRGLQVNAVAAQQLARKVGSKTIEKKPTAANCDRSQRERVCCLSQGWVRSVLPALSSAGDDSIG